MKHGKSSFPIPFLSVINCSKAIKSVVMSIIESKSISEGCKSLVKILIVYLQNFGVKVIISAESD